jgi:hypothetical protein
MLAHICWGLEQAQYEAELQRVEQRRAAAEEWRAAAQFADDTAEMAQREAARAGAAEANLRRRCDQLEERLADGAQDIEAQIAGLHSQLACQVANAQV